MTSKLCKITIMVSKQLMFWTLMMAWVLCPNPGSSQGKPIKSLEDDKAELSKVAQLNFHQSQKSNVVIQTRIVSGTVNSADGTTIPGVNIVEKNTNNGTVTDVEGNYSLEVPASAILVFSFVGFLTVEREVGNQSVINVTLAEDIRALEEIIVVGYSSQRKIDVTGSISQVKGEDISKQPSVNPISALQGKVAGVQITNKGAPGSSPEIRIRGTGTVYGNANPLYVVDGVWFDDISFLNPADIENISILKDASSEAIYGVRAANGVVLITTKRGTQDGQTVVSYSGFVGNQIVSKQIEMANGPEFATMINELDQANGVQGRYANPSQYGTTNWYRQILRNAPIHNHQLSVAGGSERSTYNFSLGYLNQDGIVEKNAFKRYTARLQNDFQPMDFLKLGYTITGALNDSRDNNNSIFHQLYSAAPIVPVYYADGTYGDPNDFSLGSSNLFNPQVTIDVFDQNSRQYRMTGNIFAELSLTKDLTFRTSLGGDYGQKEIDNYSPEYTATLSQRNTVSKLTLTNESTRNWILENLLTYDRIFGEHGIKLLLGQGAQSYRTNGTVSSAENVPNFSSGDRYLKLGDNRLVEEIGGILYNTIASYFGRLNYSFNEKYLLTASMRADGSSKFAGENRWGYFPAVGIGWIISEEGFMGDQTIFDNLKLRASWGKIGNMSVPANLSILRVTQTPQLIYIGGDGSTSQGASINTIVPPTTFWERGVGTDIGLEANLLNNRLFFEIDFYNKKTERAIFDIPILGSLGTSGGNITGNQADFQNQGVEFLLSWNNQVGEDMSYSVSGNIGYNKNKVLSVSTGANPIYQAVGTTGSNNFNTRTIVGEPIGHFYGLQVVGVFQSEADVSNYKDGEGEIIQPNAKPGDFKFADNNNDGIIDDKDRIVLGNPNPKYTFGLNSTFNYKAFDLTLDLQGVAGVEIYNATLGLRFGTENFTKEFFDNRWHGQGTSNTYPSANIGGGQNYRSNSFYVEDGSYVRVRNAQLGYRLPNDLVQGLNMSNLRIYVNAQNALNFFKYRGFSPEIGGGPTRAGVDVNVYPLYATFNFGVNVTF